MAEISGTVINSYVQTLVDVACKSGLSREEVLSPLKGEKDLPEQPAQRIPMNLMTRLWQHVARLTSDPDLGLHVGETVRPGSFHILAPLVMNCETLSDSIGQMIRYQSLVSEGGDLSMQTEDRQTKLIYTPGIYSIPMTRYQVECIFTGIVTFAHWLLHRELPLVEICFTHKISHDTDEYKRVFNCPVFFARSENSILISDHHLNLKIPHADPGLLSHHQEIAERLLVARQQKDQTIHELVTVMKSDPEGARLSLDAAADRLFVSPRTLQRRLRKSGSSFQEIQNSIRMNRAHDLLISTDLAVSAISENLGYLNSSSFHRRFKSWYGLTPHQYRKTIETDSDEH